VPVAVELSLDAEASAVVAGIWERLRGIGVTYMLDCASVPHVTIAVYERVHRPAYEAAVTEFASRASGLRFHFAMLGVFPTTRVVAAAPTPTPELLSFHEGFHERFLGIGVDPQEHYLPGEWVPHCTLAMEFPDDKWNAVLTVIRTEWQPFSASARSLMLVEFTERCESVDLLHECHIP